MKKNRNTKKVVHGISGQMTRSGYSILYMCGAVDGNRSEDTFKREEVTCPHCLSYAAKQGAK